MNEDAFRSFSCPGMIQLCYVNRSNSDRESEFMSRIYTIYFLSLF